MKRILAIAIAAFWAAYFGILAVSAMSPGVDSSLVGWGAMVPAPLTGLLSHGATPWLAAALAFGFCLATVLFLWMLVSALIEGDTRLGETDEVTRLAVAVAIGVVALAMVVGWTQGAGWSPGTASVHVLALAASFLAIAAENRERRTAVEDVANEPRSRLMASSAAYDSVLGRLSGRPQRGTEGPA